MPRRTCPKAEVAETLPASAVGDAIHERGGRAGRQLTEAEIERFAGILAEDGCQDKIARKPIEVRRIIAAYDAGMSLRQCAMSIRDNIDTDMAAAGALLKVRDNRLYLLRHKTFEAYIVAEFQLAMRHAYNLTRALGVATAVNKSIGGEPVIVDAAQARGLMRLRRVSKAAVDAEDQEASMEERLKIVAEVRRQDASVPAKLLARSARKRMAEIKGSELRKLGTPRFRRSLDACLRDFKRNLAGICAKAGMEAGASEHMIACAEELEALVKELAAGAKRG